MKKLRLLVLIMTLSIEPSLLFAGTPTGRVIHWGAEVFDDPTAIRFNGMTTNWVIVEGHPLTNAIAVSAGVGHGIALLNDGTVAGWGDNALGEAVGLPKQESHPTNGLVKIDGKILSNVTAITISYTYSLALTRDGKIIAWGATVNGDEIEPPKDSGNFTQVAAGDDYCLALRDDGTVIGWGGLRRPPAGLSNVVAIAAGPGPYSPNAALNKDGVVIAWSPGIEYQDGRVIASNAVAISVGNGHCLALHSNGTVSGWGSNGRGEATGVPNPITITNTSDFSTGLVTIGGQVLRNVTAIAAGDGYSLALKRDGTVFAWGNNPWHTTDVPPGLSNVVAIAAGGNYCLAITTMTNFSDLKK